MSDERALLPPDVSACIVDYDATSRWHGSSNVAAVWKRTLGDRPSIVFDRQLGGYIPSLLPAALLELYEEGRRCLLLGGDHSLSWHVLSTLMDITGPLTVVHFDAHHDAYETMALTHYSVFHHVSSKLPVRVVGVGYRHDHEPLPDLLEEEIRGPVYISFDVDYLSPEIVPSVMHAVPPGPGQRCSLDAVEDNLGMIRGPVVGADIVEWMGPSSEAEYSAIRGLIKMISQKMR